MRFGLMRKMIGLYVVLVRASFSIRKFLFGFRNANELVRKVDRAAVIALLKMSGAVIGKNCCVESGITFHNCEDYTNLIIGDNCHIGKGCFFDLTDRITIGNNVVVSMQNTFITHIDLPKSKLSQCYASKKAPITICNDVYMGARSTILMGVTINKESLIAAGSLVNKETPSHVVCAGVPAKIIKKLNLL